MRNLSVSPEIKDSVPSHTCLHSLWTNRDPTLTHPVKVNYLAEFSLCRVRSTAPFSRGSFALVAELGSVETQFQGLPKVSNSVFLGVSQLDSHPDCASPLIVCPGPLVGPCCDCDTLWRVTR